MGRWTQFADVERRHHAPIPPAHRGWVDALIEDAEDELTRVVPDLVARVEGGTLPQLRVQRATVSAILRIMRNPEGYIQSTQTAGPFTRSGTRNAAAVATEIRYTDDELALVASDGAAVPVRSIGVGIPTWRIP